MCVANLEDRGWAPDQISGWFTFQPTTHFNAWERDIALGRRQCVIAIRKRCDQHYNNVHREGTSHNLQRQGGAGPPPPNF
eukprot:1646095-Lingulodinium_polyedra.AAC.1